MGGFCNYLSSVNEEAAGRGILPPPAAFHAWLVKLYAYHCWAWRGHKPAVHAYPAHFNFIWYSISVGLGRVFRVKVRDGFEWQNGYHYFYAVFKHGVCVSQGASYWKCVSKTTVFVLPSVNVTKVLVVVMV
jgi:hypothetical protein